MWTLTLILLLATTTTDTRLVYIEGARVYATRAECVRALEYAQATTFLDWELSRADCMPRTAV